jgi:glycyl-tRNA synthetase beta chain
MTREDLLFEIGTEELPPASMQLLRDALQQEFLSGLNRAGLIHGDCTAFATPRRLALLVKSLATLQPDRTTDRRGPALQAAFDAAGKPTKAAEGFARSCGTSIDQLERLENDKGSWLHYQVKIPGKPAAEVLPQIAQEALSRLPVSKRMRWGSSEVEFVRPVHWLLFMHGRSVIPCTLLDAPAGNSTRGHRFHHPHALTLSHPGDYERLLWSEAHVIPDFARRRDLIREMVEKTAANHHGSAVIDADLLDEVTALVEWPIPVLGSFEAQYLEVPHEALILTMKKNQKYFHMVDGQGRLLPSFIAIANILSPEPELIRMGNERVIRPRLADAMFFWRQDGKKRLEEHLDSLKEVVFQQQLGSMYDKSQRVAELAAEIADSIGGDPALARRAGMLSRCDLMTEMVGEFADMQGVMGRYQLQRDGESSELAQAMEEFYQPRFSGDRLPQSHTGIAIALAERIDTLCGIFGINQRPTGDKDPFALRRAALGALRILREHRLPLSLVALLQQSARLLEEHSHNSEVVVEVHDFMLERLRGLYAEEGVPAELFHAVAAIQPQTLPDFDQRIQAVAAFRRLPEAESLAAANKRIRNLLKKSPHRPTSGPMPSLYSEEAETRLHQHLQATLAAVEPLLQQPDYAAALKRMAQLRDDIDRYFDDVMVMTDDEQTRNNRLALLDQLGSLFLRVADISLLPS